MVLVRPIWLRLEMGRGGYSLWGKLMTGLQFSRVCRSNSNVSYGSRFNHQVLGTNRGFIIESIKLKLFISFKFIRRCLFSSSLYTELGPRNLPQQDPNPIIYTPKYGATRIDRVKMDTDRAPPPGIRRESKNADFSLDSMKGTTTVTSQLGNASRRNLYWILGFQRLGKLRDPYSQETYQSARVSTARCCSNKVKTQNQNMGKTGISLFI